MSDGFFKAISILFTSMLLFMIFHFFKWAHEHDYEYKKRLMRDAIIEARLVEREGIMI